MTYTPHTRLKPRAGGVISRLTDEQREQLDKWLHGAVSYNEILKRMLKQWGISTYSRALVVYNRQRIASQILERRSSAFDVAAELNSAIRKKPGRFAKAIHELVASRYFVLLSDEHSHPKILEIFAKQYKDQLDFKIRERQLRFKERHIRLLENQTEAARKTAEDSKLTPEQKQKRFEKIFAFPIPLTDDESPEAKNKITRNRISA